MLSVAAISASIGAAPASASIPNIHEGSTGYGVKCVQLALNHWAAGLAVDGIDGPQTTAAVKTYQFDLEVATDGIVGPVTGQYILEDDAFLGYSNCVNYVPH